MKKKKLLSAENVNVYSALICVISFMFVLGAENIGNDIFEYKDYSIKFIYLFLTSLVVFIISGIYTEKN